MNAGTLNLYLLFLINMQIYKLFFIYKLIDLCLTAFFIKISTKIYR